MSIIPSLDEDIISNPFPFIIGACASEEEKWKIPEMAEYVVTVLLDTGEIIQNKDMLANTFPALLNHKIQQYYKPFEVNHYEAIEPVIINNPTHELVEAAKLISTEVESILQKNIFDKLPRIEELKELTIENILSLIIERIDDENRVFVEELIQTQMFVVYLEKYYGYLD